jgi:hypothetical protein
LALPGRISQHLKHPVGCLWLQAGNNLERASRHRLTHSRFNRVDQLVQVGHFCFLILQVCVQVN